MRLRNIRLIAAGAAAMLAVGATGVVLAQDPGAGDSSAASDTREHRPHRLARAVIGVHQIVEASGLDGSLFREGFKNGQSINDVLAANGVDPAAVQATVLANLEAQLAERVAAGEIDQARADEILAKAPERLSNLMSSVPDGEHRGRPFARVAALLGVMDSAAETIGITVSELHAEMFDTGGTIADVATAHGVDPQDVIEDAIGQAEARVDEAVANGRITPERGEEITANLAQRIAKIVNEKHHRDAP